MPPTYCGPNCEETGPICDFCKHYDFNGDATGAYTGDGFCNLHKRESDPIDACDDFFCFKIQEP